MAQEGSQCRGSVVTLQSRCRCFGRRRGGRAAACRAGAGCSPWALRCRRTSPLACEAGRTFPMSVVGLPEHAAEALRGAFHAHRTDAFAADGVILGGLAIGGGPRGRATFGAGDAEFHRADQPCGRRSRYGGAADVAATDCASCCAGPHASPGEGRTGDCLCEGIPAASEGIRLPSHCQEDTAWRRCEIRFETSCARWWSRRGVRCAEGVHGCRNVQFSLRGQSFGRNLRMKRLSMRSFSHHASVPPKTSGPLRKMPVPSPRLYTSR